jgi:hypothetical protein
MATLMKKSEPVEVNSCSPVPLEEDRLQNGKESSKKLVTEDPQDAL